MTGCLLLAHSFYGHGRVDSHNFVEHHDGDARVWCSKARKSSSLRSLVDAVCRFL